MTTTTGELPVERDTLGAGVRIHYLDWGPGPEPTLIFLHGAGLHARSWDRVCVILRHEHRCLSLDLRGHGDSEWHHGRDYTYDAHAADLAAVKAELGLRRVVLIGHSLGGGTALTYAAAHPDEVLGLVLVDIGPTGARDEGRRFVGEIMAGPSEYATVDELVDRVSEKTPGRSRDRLRASLMENLRQTPRGTWAWKYDPGISRRARDAGLTEEQSRQRFEERNRMLWEAAKRVTCPTLVVRGGASVSFFDEDAARTAAGFPHARWLRIEGARHVVQRDKPQELSDALREFIAKDLAR